MRDPREIEREIDNLRAEQARILAMPVDQMPPQDGRDQVMRITGQIGVLEVQAREARDDELKALQDAIAGGTVVSGTVPQDVEQRKAFADFVRHDIVNAALLTTPDANGGYMMPNPVREAMIDIVRKQNPIMADATVINLTKPGTFSVELPKKLTATAGGWVAETAARPATNAPTIGMQTLECFEWYANPEVTQSFLDAVEGAEQFVIDDISDTFSEVLGTGLAVGVGPGSKQPSGLFAATSYFTPKLSTTADSLDALQILGSYFALPAKFLPAAKFYGNGATFATLSALAWPNLNDTPLVVWNNGVPSIMSKPIVICDDAPAIGNGLFPVAFGDVKRGYAVGLHTALTVLRDPYTNKPYVSFYTRGRAGGVPWDPKAVLLLKSDNA